MAGSSELEHNQIETFVIFKVETTGRPWDGGMATRIVELYCKAVPRKFLLQDKIHQKDLDKLDTFHEIINPERYMGDEASQATGIYNDSLDSSPTFEVVFNFLKFYLEDLPKPVCLVAHNGNTFDFRMLSFECNIIAESLAEDFFCADSKIFFQSLLKGTPGRSKYNLPALYQRYVGVEKSPMRAEEKAGMLLECILKNKEDFLSWADENCSSLMAIAPFYSYNKEPKVEAVFPYYE